MRRVMLVLTVLIVMLVLSAFVVAYHGSNRRTSYIQSDEFIISSTSNYRSPYGAPRMAYRTMPVHRVSYFIEEPYPRYLENRGSGKVHYTVVDDRERYGLQRILYQPFPAACPYPLVMC